MTQENPLQAPEGDQAVHNANNQLLKNAVVMQDEPDSTGEVPRWYNSTGTNTPHGAYWGKLYSDNFRSDAWTVFTPTLTADTTSPTLGTGGTCSGVYTRQADRLIVVRYYIQFGTSGISAGSGPYHVGLPLAMTAAFGSGFALDASTNVTYVCIPRGWTTTDFIIHAADTASASNYFTHAYPTTWAVSDIIFAGGLTGEAAS